MADPKVKVVLTIDGKQYEAGLDRADGKTEQFSETTERTAANVSQLHGAVKLLVGAFAGIQLASLIRDISRTGLEFEALENQLKFATGSSEEATTSMAFIRTEANRLGLELIGTARSYSGIAAAAKDTRLEGEATRQIFLGVAEASTALSLSSEQSEGALRALEQMISKGTVQAEELRGQLGERIPGAFQIAARAMGVSTAELNKMLEQGEVISDEFLPRFAAELRKTFGQAAVDNADSAQAAFNRFESAVQNLSSAFGDESGLNNLIKESANLLADWLNQLSGAPRSIEVIEAEIAATESRLSRAPKRRGGRRGAINARLADLQSELLEARIGSSDPEQIRQAIETLNAQIDNAQARVNALPQQGPSIGRGRNRRVNKFEIENKNLQRLIDDRKALYGRLDKLNNPAQQDNVGGGAGGGSETPASPSTLEQKLQRQLALYGQVGEAARVRYEVEQGSLTNLSEDDKERLINMAKELDLRKANDAATRDQIATQNAAIEADKQAAAAKRQAAEAALQAVEQAAFTEHEQENQRYQIQLEQLQLAEDAKLQTLIGYDELRERLKIEHEDRLTQIENNANRTRLRNQQVVERAILQAKMMAANQAIALLQIFGQRSKAAAIASIALQKAVAITNIKMTTEIAAMQALASQIIPGDPTSLARGAAAAATVRGWGLVSMGLVAATGLAQIAGAMGNQRNQATGVYSANPATGLPDQTVTTASPYASSVSTEGRRNSGGSTTIEIYGDRSTTFTADQIDFILESISEAVERGDRILIRGNSAQAMEIRNPM